MKNIFYIFIVCIFFTTLYYLSSIERFESNFVNNKDLVISNNIFKTEISYKDSKHLENINSPYQKIDVYSHPKLGNILTIDDDLQITTFDEKNYHEMIVHVPLNYIPNAENVLIIGGGDGGTLTEVLKHKNLKNIYNVEIDINVINMSKKYFPHIGKSFDNPRANVIISDANKWVDKQQKSKNRYFDFVILDITDFGASETIFRKEFFIKLKKLMKINSIFTCNFCSLQFTTTTVSTLQNTIIGSIFKNKYIYQIFQPTFEPGHYCFMFCSDNINPINSIIDWKTFEKKNIETDYYNKKIHKASFVLPNKIIGPIEKSLKPKLGILIAINLYGCPFNLINNKNNIDEFFDKTNSILNLTQVNRISKKFSPQGITMISLLEESHLSIHTWPEKNSACIDIFSCGDFPFQNINLLNVLIKKYFKPSKIVQKQLDR